MSIIKKFWIALFWIITIFSINIWFCRMDNWEDPSYRNKTYKPETPKVGTSTITDIGDWPKTFSDKLQWILHLPKPENYNTSLWYIITLIQIAVNRLLWILAFVALVYMLYCWFLVFTSGSDDKNASKGKKWISTAAIALAWIWVSWLIISAIIRFIEYISNSGN